MWHNNNAIIHICKFKGAQITQKVIGISLYIQCQKRFSFQVQFILKKNDRTYIYSIQFLRIITKRGATFIEEPRLQRISSLNRKLHRQTVAWSGSMNYSSDMIVEAKSLKGDNKCYNNIFYYVHPIGFWLCDSNMRTLDGHPVSLGLFPHSFFLPPLQ